MPPAMYHAPRISPNGRTLAYSIGNDLASDVWTYDLATGETIRLTSSGRAAAPLWTRDGTGLIVSWFLGGGRALARLTVGSTTAEPALIRSPSAALGGSFSQPASWADGGRAVLVRQLGGQNTQALWTLAVDGKSEPQPFARRNAAFADISPDGRWIAYSAPELPQSRPEIFAAPFPAGAPEWKLSREGGVMPVWAKNGREVFYRYRNAIMSVPVTLGETFTSGTPQLLFEAPFYEGDPGSPNYDVAPDNQRFILVLPGSTEGPDRLHVIQGWKAEILRRLNHRG